ncbi:Uncharacterised protein [Vibrio cholerae]|nr:Uncharacterised protein [Vibrio cholerae]
MHDYPFFFPCGLLAHICKQIHAISIFKPLQPSLGLAQ